MSLHDLWHTFVLGTTLFAGASVVLVLLVPLLFEETPGGLGRARAAVGGLAIGALALLAVEWLRVH